MKYIRVILLSIAFMFFVKTGIAQIYQGSRTVISALGGSYGGVNNTGEFTIGEVAIFTFSGMSGNNNLTQGFHQGDEFTKVDLPAENSDQIRLKAYPNPVRDWLTVVLKNAPNTQIDLRIYNLSGKLMKSIKMESEHLRIDMSELKSGTYFIHAVDKLSGKRINTVKTQKL